MALQVETPAVARQRPGDEVIGIDVVSHQSQNESRLGQRCGTTPKRRPVRKHPRPAEFAIDDDEEAGQKMDRAIFVCRVERTEVRHEDRQFRFQRRLRGKPLQSDLDHAQLRERIPFQNCPIHERDPVLIGEGRPVNPG
ncbi:hypothetical protein D3C72_1674770 [compost metagenome]